MKPQSDASDRRAKDLRIQRMGWDAKLWWYHNKDKIPLTPAPVDPLKKLSDQLPEMPRLIYRLMDVEGLDENEVAVLTERSPARVRKALALARSKLKALLA